MSSSARATVYRWPWLVSAVVLAAVGLGLFLVPVVRLERSLLLLQHLALMGFGWGPLAELGWQVSQIGTVLKGVPTGVPMGPGFWGAIGLWGLAMVSLAMGVRSVTEAEDPPSPAVGKPLYPRLAQYRDFHWATLGAYGGGILLAEVAVILVHTLLASGAPSSAQAVARGPQWAPPLAFGVALIVGSLIVFWSGFLGTAHARRMAVPEATIAVVYLGLPIPILLTLVNAVFTLQLQYGALLREILYVAWLIGRPELGIWLVFAELVLMLVFGITAGFVATGSGRADLKMGFELFVARRHVKIFQPRLLIGVFAILIFGIVPPLIIMAILRAAHRAVRRTHIRALGLQDPLKATAALQKERGQEHSPTEMMTALSVGGVGVGVMALIVVMSVMSGFEQDFQSKILGTTAHAIILKYTDNFSDYPDEYRDVMKKAAQVPGIVGQTPFIMNEVMVNSEGNIGGVMIKGIDPETVGSVSDLPRNILPGGSIDYLAHPERLIVRQISPTPEDGKGEETEPDDEIIRDLDKEKSEPDVTLPGLLVGRELAASLKVIVGDRVNVTSPFGGELGPQGPLPKSRPFRVAGIFYSGMYEYDSKFVYIALKEAQKFFDVKGATGIELKMADADDARKIAREVVEKLDGYPYRTKDWGEMNRNLFSALRLEKLVMGIILSIIVIVAAGLIVATVIMLVLEKRKDIAVLKALGVSDGGVVKIFLAEGLQIGVAGGFLGLVSGLIWCLFVDKIGIQLDPEVYYIASLPVRIEPLQTALFVFIALLVTYLGSIYPALKASQVEPVEGLKSE